ncbi:MAG TPA: S41 family peptidase [Candidatus Acidoferrum sp.]|nr:S41 family peptidase [Candidatus Acidoferrum sp.]
MDTPLTLHPPVAGGLARRRPNSWPLALAFCSGLALGWLGAMGCASASKSQPDFRLMAQAWNTIQNHYVDPTGIQPTELTYGAISGMVDSLGDTGHSTFLTPDMVKELRTTERGEFKGVGIEIQMKNGRAVVVAPLDDSPAQKAGLQPGDLILKVSGEDITDWPISRVVDHISGRAGTKVRLTVQDARSSRTREVTLVRASIKLHEVTWQRLPGTANAHLRLASFDAGVTRDLQKALTEIQRDKLNGIILDLRNNPGGLLDEAVGVASQFLNGGNVLLAKDAKGNVEPIPTDKGGVATNLPLVVLVNEGSASAAEIVAGAFQDTHRAKLVGGTTFGTGTVLQRFRLSDGSALLLAVEEWLTPNGRSFWHKGITPEVTVTLPSEVNPLLPSAERGMSAEQLQRSEDGQLLAALRLLSRQTEVSKVGALKR